MGIGGDLRARTAGSWLCGRKGEDNVGVEGSSVRG